MGQVEEKALCISICVWQVWTCELNRSAGGATSVCPPVRFSTPRWWVWLRPRSGGNSWYLCTAVVIVERPYRHRVLFGEASREMSWTRVSSPSMQRKAPGSGDVVELPSFSDNGCSGAICRCKCFLRISFTFCSFILRTITLWVNLGKIFPLQPKAALL